MHLSVRTDPTKSKSKDAAPRGEEFELRPLLGVDEVSQLLGIPKATLPMALLIDIGRTSGTSRVPHGPLPSLHAGGRAQLHRTAEDAQRLITTRVRGGHGAPSDASRASGPPGLNAPAEGTCWPSTVQPPLKRQGGT